jgi:hypothetical protein
MTTYTAVPPAATVDTRGDTRTFRRIVAAVLLPLGPLSVALLRGILPYYTSDDTTEMVRHTAAGLGRQDAVLWLSLVAILALIPSALAAGWLARRGAPVLSLLGVGLLVPAFAMLPFFAGDPALRMLAGGVVDQSTAARLLDAQNDLVPVIIAGVVFVVGHILGTILIGAALWRARMVPIWAAVALIVSQPLHLVFAVFVPNHLLDGLAWGLTALGFAVAALRVLRTPNDAWDIS